MKQYVDLVRRILDSGERRLDRTGTGTLSVFGGRMDFDLREYFPLVTIKETRHKVAFLEMLWFLRGEPHTNYLKENNCKLWDAWTLDANGSLGPIYGVQWRDWNGEGLDQIKRLIDDLKMNPISRRHIVSAWNVSKLSEMGLPPCHRDFQCYVSNDGYLDLMVSQRSWDVALGAPFNIAQYALLTHLLARATGLKPRNLSFNYGDAHIYLDHAEEMRKLLDLPAMEDVKPKLVFLTGNTDIDGYRVSDFRIDDYRSHPFVKLAISV